jgi:hypothetical protein
MTKLVAKTSDLFTTLPHDKIYGLFGLFQWLRVGEPLHDAPPPFVVDYQQKPAAVFRDAMRQMILESEGLGILTERRTRQSAPRALITGNAHVSMQ